MREIRTEIQIRASPERVWAVLTDFASFHQWNPFILTVNGNPRVGAKLKIQIRTLRGKNRVYSPTITKVDVNHDSVGLENPLYQDFLMGNVFLR